MKKIKIIFVVCICIISGLLCFGANLIYQWTIVNNQDNSISFFKWLASTNGMNLLMNGVGDIGISLIGSAIFLICVDWFINRLEDKRKLEVEIEHKRFTVQTEMRNNPQTMIKMLKTEEGSMHEGLFNKQFFGGCDFSNLDLDNIDFSESNLTGVKFNNSSLIGANFYKCILKGANIQNAKLSFANLKDTDLKEDDLKTAYSLWNTILPNGEKYDGRFMLEGDILEAEKFGLDIVNNESQKKLFFSEVSN